MHQLINALTRLLKLQNIEAWNSSSASAGTGLSSSGTERFDPSWRVILDAMSDPALVVDETGVVVHHNPLVADLYPRVRVGSPIALLSREPALLAAIDRARDVDQRIVVNLQDRVPVMRHMSAIISRLAIDEPPAGAPAVLIILRDLTDQEKHAQMRADFIAHASHELRTPLASLRLIVETLQGAGREDDHKRERFLSMMLVQATRMSRLIDDLLSLNRVEMNAHLPPRGSVELSELLDTVVQSLEPLARASNINLHLANELSLVSVRGDREDLLQVFQNLVQNAVRYGRNQGNVWVNVAAVVAAGRGAGADASHVRVRVTDDGIGIEPEHLPRLTERFYRVSAVDSRAKGGTGLGLAIVKHILTRHRADLDIESTFGEGSTFTVTFKRL